MGALNINRITDPSVYNPRQLQRLRTRLAALGIAVPADPTPARLRTAIAQHLGAVLDTEIATDPEGIGYAGAPNDAAIATMMLQRSVNARFVPQTPLLKRTAQSGTTITCAAENGKPLQLSRFLGAPGLGIRFYELTPTVALRDGRVAQAGFLSDIQIELDTVPAAMTDDDLFRVEVRVGKVNPERLRALFRGIPLAPNGITGQDITDARA